MELVNPTAFEKAIVAYVGDIIEEGANGAMDTMIDQELPKGMSSPTADTIEVKRINPATIEIQTRSKIWAYLSEGTGIWGPYKGKGAGGRIEATNGKMLHFKSAELAEALGFPTEDVFLKSVQGIQPRFLWDKYFIQQLPVFIKDAHARMG